MVICESVLLMRSLRSNCLVAFVIAAIMQTSSCTPESCLEETIAEIKVPLYLSSTQKIQAPDSLTLYGLNSGSGKIHNKDKNVKMVLLPLNPSAENCGFVIRINGTADTILIWYDSFPHLISKECGYTYYHTIDSLIFTKNIIDTIKIKNKSVTTVNEENMRILY
jgi:hypothetical protein